VEAAGIDGAAGCGPCVALDGPTCPYRLSKTALPTARRDPPRSCKAPDGTSISPNLSKTFS